MKNTYNSPSSFTSINAKSFKSLIKNNPIKPTSPINLMFKRKTSDISNLTYNPDRDMQLSSISMPKSPVANNQINLNIQAMNTKKVIKERGSKSNKLNVGMKKESKKDVLDFFLKYSKKDTALLRLNSVSNSRKYSLNNNNSKQKLNFTKTSLTPSNINIKINNNSIRKNLVEYNLRMIEKKNNKAGLEKVTLGYPKPSHISYNRQQNFEDKQSKSSYYGSNANDSSDTRYASGRSDNNGSVNGISKLIHCPNNLKLRLVDLNGNFEDNSDDTESQTSSNLTFTSRSNFEFTNMENKENIYSNSNTSNIFRKVNDFKEENNIDENVAAVRISVYKFESLAKKKFQLQAITKGFAHVKV